MTTKSRLLFIAAITLSYVRCNEFSSYPTTVKASENDTVLLPCYLETITNDGIVYNRVRWYKGNELLTDSGPPLLTPPDRFTLWENGSLQVENLRPQDTSDYVCEIVRPSPWSTARQMHAIEVLHAPSVEPDPINGYLEVRINEEVRMSCRPQGVPYPAITWFANGKEMQLLDGREMLKFVALNKNLSGLYECVAQNGVGASAKAAIKLNIIYPPEILTYRHWIHTAPGFRAQIECIVSADPPAAVSWWKGEIPVSFDNRIISMNDGNKYILLIRNMTFNDFGIYTCRASNDLGQGDVQIQLSGVANPAVFKQADQKNINTKSSHKLIWEVDSYTPVIEYNLWFRPYRSDIGTKRAEWTKLTIPAEYGTGPMHSKAYTLTGLSERTVYETLLASRNRYGWSKPSAILRFATDGTDLMEDTITPIHVQLQSEFVPLDTNHISGSSCLNQTSFMLLPIFLILLINDKLVFY